MLIIFMCLICSLILGMVGVGAAAIVDFDREKIKQQVGVIAGSFTVGYIMAILISLGGN